MRRMYEKYVWRLDQDQIDNLLSVYPSEEGGSIASEEELAKIRSAEIIEYVSSWGRQRLRCISDYEGYNEGKLQSIEKVFASYEPALSSGGYGAGFLIGFSCYYVDYGEGQILPQLKVYTDEI